MLKNTLVSRKKESPTKKKSSFKDTKSSIFPVVAVGASAGGLEAFSVLLQNLPSDTGMAFIYVQHLSPNHKSLLTSILSKVTEMQVQDIDDMEFIKPDNVYVIPNDKGIEVTNGHIKLIPRSTAHEATSIDVLFSSLAETHKENVIGIILSGNGTDGTKGLKAIKDAGGITFAQDDSAQANSMPKSVIASGAVDFVLSPQKMAAKLVHFAKTGFIRSEAKEKMIEHPMENNDPGLKAILEILHKKVNVEFSRYKMTTVKRRITHRMLQCNIKTIKEYVKFLEKKNNETDILYKDLLINVTSFFRDTETFNYLKNDFLPKLLKEKPAGSTLRIWVPACSSGEEAYSIAMLIAEIQENKTKKIPVQIFATDLSDQAIRDGRMGEYSKSDVLSVGKKRTERFFTQTGDTYKIIKELRAMCVFAPHNILRDPPFSRIDFISCRNLLIYFDATAQKKAFATMNFALKEGGYLMLGKSETTGISSPFFTPVSHKFKMYSQKKSTGTRKIPELGPHFPRTFQSKKNPDSSLTKNTPATSTGLDSVINSTLLTNYMPACAIINKDMEILKFRGSTHLYLSHPSGNASLNILKMTRPEFAFELRNAIQTVMKTQKPVHKMGIEMNPGIIGASVRTMSLDVCPLKIDWDEPLLLIVFTHQEQPEILLNGSNGKNNSKQKNLKIKRQAEELSKVRMEMHSVIEAQEKAYEELQAANEEIVSTNEEFQTLNEELETSKEEIEATSEELITTNQELQTRNEQLGESYEFSKAVSETMHEPMLILDKNLRIKSANKAFYKMFRRLQAGTEGKLVYELGNHQWNIPRLRKLLGNIVQKDAYFYDYEITHVFPTIGKKTMLLNAARIIQKTQDEQLILLTFIDATERTQKGTAEKQGLEDIIAERTTALENSHKILEEKNLFLEKANKELETFNYISSHDLQEPLRKVKVFATCLLREEEVKLSDLGKTYLQRMNETIKRMQMLINDLLAYSRVKTDAQNFERTDLSEMTQDIIKDLKKIIDEKKAKIKTAGLSTADIIPLQFRHLLGHLISNSLKFSHPKRFPRVLIKSKTALGKVFNIDALSPEADYCHLTYTDNGIGFDPRYKERIFEVFQRLHEYDEYKGTGIGLAICKRIAENHKGIITATGKLDKGAQFDIYIPVIHLS